MQKKLLSDYYLLEMELKSLEERREALRQAIVEDLKMNNLGKIESNFGSFTICQKKNWSYSDKIKLLEDKVKIEKEKEQKKGIAEVSISEYLLYKHI